MYPDLVPPLFVHSHSAMLCVVCHRTLSLLHCFCTISVFPFGALFGGVIVALYTHLFHGFIGFNLFSFCLSSMQHLQCLFCPSFCPMPCGPLSSVLLLNYNLSKLLLNVYVSFVALLRLSRNIQCKMFELFPFLFAPLNREYDVSFSAFCFSRICMISKSTDPFCLGRSYVDYICHSPNSKI